MATKTHYQIIRDPEHLQWLELAKSYLFAGRLEDCANVCYGLLDEPSLDRVDRGCAYLFLACSTTEGASYARRAVFIFDNIVQEYPQHEHMRELREVAEGHFEKLSKKEAGYFQGTAAAGMMKTAREAVLKAVKGLKAENGRK